MSTPDDKWLRSETADDYLALRHTLGVWRYSRMPSIYLRRLNIDTAQQAGEALREMAREDAVWRHIGRLDSAKKSAVYEKLRKRLLDGAEASELSHDDRHIAIHAYDLALSSILRHDTGKKGSLSLVSVGGPAISYRDGEAIVCLPDDPRLLGKMDAEFLKFNCQTGFEARTRLFEDLPTGDRYEFSVFLGERLRLQQHDVDSLNELQNRIERIIAWKALSTLTEPFFIPFSVDYLLSERGPILLEIHCPPRGVALQYYGFEPFYRNIRFPRAVFSNALVRLLRSRNSANRVQIVVPSGLAELGFFYYEALLLKESLMDSGPMPDDESEHLACWLVEVTKDLSEVCRDARILIPPPSIAEFVNDRVPLYYILRENGIMVPSTIMVEEPEKLKIDQIISALGPLVAVKPSTHLSWWNKNKVRVQLLNLRIPEHRDRILALGESATKISPLLIEKVVVDSLDSFGSHGELKLFSIVTNVT